MNRLKRAQIKAYYALAGWLFERAEDLEWGDK